MANIESVRLPNGTSYDINDANAVQVADIVDNLTSTATDKPLAANMGRVLKNNLYKRNLLKNGWFTINEKGQVSYSSHDDYTVNDWKMNYSGGAGTVDVTSNGLTLTGSYIYINQPYDATPLTGKQITASILLSDNTIKTGTATWAGADIAFYNDDDMGVSLLADSTVGFIVYNTSGSPVTFKAVKLELGSESTLANDIAPDKTLELLKCQEADVSGLSNENLLDNGWFTVNQRGATTVTSGYGADRWQKSAGTSATFSSNGVTIANYSQISQPLETAIPNGTYTLSIKLSDGTIVSGTNVKVDDVSTLYFIDDGTYSLYYYPASKSIVVWVATSTTIRAVKLERGGKSTLAHDTEPDYTTELLKCQRYFKVVFNDTWNVGIGVAMATDTIEFYYSSDVPMRTTPSVSTTGTISAIRIADGSEVIISSAEISLDLNNKNGRINFKTGTTLTIRDLYVIRMNNAEVMLSAEL